MTTFWWIGALKNSNGAFIFSAPNQNAAYKSASDSDANLFTAGVGSNSDGSFDTQSAATAAAKLQFNPVSGGSGGGSPQPTPPPGQPPPKGKLDVATIKTVTQWVISEIGHCYAFGGTMGTDLSGCGDCSNFVNIAWGLIGGQAIPGFPAGTYTGAEHGPSTIGWLAWQGQGVGSIPRDQAQAGDLATWHTHMGFCISDSEMVSAANSTDGVMRSGIDGFIKGETLTILRLAVIGPGGISLDLPGLQDSKQIDAVVRQIAQASRGLVNTRMRLYASGKPNGRA